MARSRKRRIANAPRGKVVDSAHYSRTAAKGRVAEIKHLRKGCRPTVKRQGGTSGPFLVWVANKKSCRAGA